MRLTADLINNSLSYLNPLKERELDLRGALKRADTAHLIYSKLGHRVLLKPSP
jgi:U2 small nuclear ribonucleoprotein A'